ncbi:thioredoxin-disulfide reductase, partial [Borreliella bissettiae]
MLEFETIDVNLPKNENLSQKEVEVIEDVIIVGSGPAGLTAGIYSVMSNYKTAI